MKNILFGLVSVLSLLLLASCSTTSKSIKRDPSNVTPIAIYECITAPEKSFGPIPPGEDMQEVVERINALRAENINQLREYCEQLRQIRSSK